MKTVTAIMEAPCGPLEVEKLEESNGICIFRRGKKFQKVKKFTLTSAVLQLAKNPLAQFFELQDVIEGEQIREGL